MSPPYNIILSDVPWRFRNWSSDELASRGEKWGRANGRSPYDVMDTEDIKALPIHKLADKDCVLFFWATYPKLNEAFEIIKAWGFEYKTVAFT
jgi:N6-adenosine-specific RNA methylase IME4